MKLVVCISWTLFWVVVVLLKYSQISVQCSHSLEWLVTVRLFLCDIWPLYAVMYRRFRKHFVQCLLRVLHIIEHMLLVIIMVCLLSVVLSQLPWPGYLSKGIGCWSLLFQSEVVGSNDRHLGEQNSEQKNRGVFSHWPCPVPIPDIGLTSSSNSCWPWDLSVWGSPSLALLFLTVKHLLQCSLSLEPWDSM